MCTDKEVMFDKEKFLIYFSSSSQYENYKNIFYTNDYFNSSVWESVIYYNCGIHHELFNSNHDIYFWYESKEPAHIKWTINYCLNKYFFGYLEKIQQESNTEEMNSLIIKHEDLLEYSLFIHENLKNNYSIINVSNILQKIQ